MDLTAVRARLDQIDTQLLDLFCERLRLAGDVAAAKAETVPPGTARTRASARAIHLFCILLPPSWDLTRPDSRFE